MPEYDLDALSQFAMTSIATWTPKVLASFFVVAVGWVFAGWTRRVSRRLLKASPIDDILIPFLSGIIHVMVVAMIAVAAMGVLGVNTASFVAVLGAAGLAIALAFQGTFSNFAAGIMLLTFRPFEVGHAVEVGGDTGVVKEVGIFSCILNTGDNVQIRVPNSQIFGATITNYSANPTRRIDLMIGVGYDDDLNLAIQTCLDTVNRDDRVHADPAPVVAVHELGDSAVNLIVRPWVDASDYWATRWDLTKALKENIEAAGMSLPYPQRDVHMSELSA
ncbi:MAG: mechanosensitive ion channel domain-containing protein [Gemmatimonadota bacterium]